MALITTGCSAQKNLLITSIESSPGKNTVEDSALQKLQSENDIVIAYAIENFAWVKSIDYQIIAQKDGEWKGYRYHKNLMRSNAGSPTSFSNVAVNSRDCDAFLNYLTDNKAWEIKGDQQGNFCSDGNQNCNINDAASARLWMITKNSAINPSYYAPDFFQKCCPDTQRGLFLSITKKISTITGGSANTQ